MTEVGMPAVEAIQSATIVNAKVLEQENNLGQLAPGFYADIVASDQNALENIHTLEQISFVMKNGVVEKE